MGRFGREQAPGRGSGRIASLLGSLVRELARPAAGGNGTPDKKEQKPEESAEITTAKERITLFIDRFQKVFEQLQTDRHRTFPSSSGEYLVIAKTGNRLRMAITTKQDKDILKWPIDTENLRSWQEITFDEGNAKVFTIRLWDHGSAEKIRSGKARYWESVKHKFSIERSELSLTSSADENTGEKIKNIAMLLDKFIELPQERWT